MSIEFITFMCSVVFKICFLFRLVRIIERGLVFRYQRIAKRILNWGCMHANDEESEHIMVGLNDIFTAFAVLVFGNALSLILLLWEILLFRNQQFIFQFMQ